MAFVVHGDHGVLADFGEGEPDGAEAEVIGARALDGDDRPGAGAGPGGEGGDGDALHGLAVGLDFGGGEGFEFGFGGGEARLAGHDLDDRGVGGHGSWLCERGIGHLRLVLGGDGGALGIGGAQGRGGRGVIAGGLAGLVVAATGRAKQSGEGERCGSEGPSSHGAISGGGGTQRVGSGRAGGNSRVNRRFRVRRSPSPWRSRSPGAAWWRWCSPRAWPSHREWGFRCSWARE